MGFNVCSEYVWDIRFWGVTKEFRRVEKVQSFPGEFAHCNYLVFWLNGVYIFASVLVFINTLSANPAKWSNKLKQFVGNLATNCLSVFDHFVEFTFKGLLILFYFVLFYFDAFQYFAANARERLHPLSQSGTLSRNK